MLRGRVRKYRYGVSRVIVPAVVALVLFGEGSALAQQISEQVVQHHVASASLWRVFKFNVRVSGGIIVENDLGPQAQANAFFGLPIVYSRANRYRWVSGSGINRYLGNTHDRYTVYYNRNIWWNSQIVPEIGFLGTPETFTFLGALGARYRRMWNLIGLGASAHLLVGYKEEYRESSSPESAVGVGVRIGGDVAFFRGCLGIELAYRFTTDFVSDFSNGFELAGYLDFAMLIVLIEHGLNGGRY